MLDTTARGVYVIAVTPFGDDGAVDKASTDRLIDFYAQCGVAGVTILGMMGEAPKLAPEESLAFARQAVRRAGRLPVVVGVSAPGFAAMRALAHGVMELGAAGVMIAPPSSLKGDDAAVAYYGDAAEALGPDVPFAIQDYPLATGVVLSPGVIRRIVEANPACVMLKAEDWPGLEKISALRRLEREGGMRRVSILVGNGGLFLPFELERGADGAMTGYAYPEMLVRVCALQAEGRRAEAHDLFDAHLPLVRYEQQPGAGLAVRKYVLRKRGVLASDAQRKPGGSLSVEARAEVDFMLERLERALGEARAAA
jgi:4-hydroxy-tetrahydrodipicolinate synthase